MNVRSRNLLVCYPRHPSPSPFRARGDRQPSLNLTTKRVLQDPSPPAGDSSPRYCYGSSLLASVLQPLACESPAFLRAALGLYTPCASTERLTGVHVKSCRCYRCAVSD